MSETAINGSAPDRLLEGCRVVDFSTGLAGPYCTRLLAAAGAEVIKVEWGEGDPMRRWSASGAELGDDEDSAMFRFLNEGKFGTFGRPAEAATDALTADADIVVESFVPAVLDVMALRQRSPALVVVSVTPFGRTGPWADRASSDFTVDAEGGAIGTLGRTDGTPVRMGVRITEYIAGAYAATAALAALRRARAVGVGEHVDLSVAETANVAATALQPMGHELRGRPLLTDPARWLEVPGVEPTADGWVGLTLMSRQQFDDFLVMIDRTDLVGNNDWATLRYRFEHMDEWNAIVHPWTRDHSTAEILDLAALFRIPSAPINDGCTVATFDPFLKRGSLGACDDGSFVAPRPPIRINGQRLALHGPAPRVGAPIHTALSTRVHSARPDKAGPVPVSRPLKGVRVLDATQWYAGPVGGQLLAALGADVIHLESHVRLDGGRTNTATKDGDWWEHALIFNHANTGKSSLAIDLSRPEGLDAVRRVIAGCDVVLENYSPRVFDNNFGLGWEEMRRINPQVSFVRMPAFGVDGPWRDRVGFGETMEQCTGMAWTTGFPDEAPYQPSGPCDPLAGSHGAFAALLALEHRDQTGEGALAEVAMVETCLNSAAEPMVEYSAYGRLMQRDGNRTATAAPQGLYRCRGFEQWLALTIVADADWEALKEAMGSPAWAEDPAFGDLGGRRVRHDTIDRELAAWAAEQDLAQVVEKLVARGVAAGSLTDPRLGRLHPQFHARGVYEEVDHPVAGRLAVGAIPFRFASIDRWWHASAPTLGQHNHQVLRDVAGLDDAAILHLETAGVIGTLPTGVAAGSRVD